MTPCQYLLINLLTSCVVIDVVMKVVCFFNQIYGFDITSRIVSGERSHIFDLLSSFLHQPNHKNENAIQRSETTGGIVRLCLVHHFQLEPEPQVLSYGFMRFLCCITRITLSDRNTRSARLNGGDREV